MAETNTATSGNVLIEPVVKVLLDEYRMLYPADQQPPTTETQYFERVHAKGQAALCLSGGGIRSASFALGVLQALSAKGVLDKFHYVSSVSGGGYINSWLQRWMLSSRQATAAVAFAAAAAGQAPPASAPASNTIAAALAGASESPEIKRLRENSNFITPRVGIASNDTWTAIAMSIRNIVTNWLLFGPMLLLVALIPNLFYSCVQSIGPRAAIQPLLFNVPLAVGALSVALATWFTCRALPSYRGQAPSAPGRGDGWLFLRIVLPLLVWSVCGTLVLSAELLAGTTWLGPLESYWPEGRPFPQGGLFAIVTLAATGTAFLVAGLLRPPAYRATFVRDMLVASIALLAIPFLIVAGASLFNQLAAGISEWRGMVLTIFAPLWLIGAQLVATILFVALRKTKAKATTARPDDDREWLARLSAMKIKSMLLWAVTAFAALLLNELLMRFASSVDMSMATILAALTGTTAVAGGKSNKTGNGVSGAGGASSAGGLGGFVLKHLPVQTIIAIATFLFGMLLLLLLARLEWWAIVPISTSIADDLPNWADPDVTAHWILFAGLLLLIGLLSWRIDVNRFSLNSLYRNRLARAFLGAARPERSPDPFTGFDAEDNVRLHKLADKPDGEATRLYPIINVALNITASENLAWQERKAMPFVFSPLYCGSNFLDADPDRTYEEREGAFIATMNFGGRESDLAMEGSGVSLATAMSISGAAASPNMGYHSSPATAFLMTLFNVRLGAWMSNPAVANQKGIEVRDSGPGNSLRALVRELAGSTDDRGRDIYLSDGGHFENLGLYEMLRRGCHFIVVSDAGCDPECAYADLGNAVRKAKIDLNIEIVFTNMKISRRGQEVEGQLAWALGTITYPRREGEPAEIVQRTGKILYLKPSYFDEGNLPADVVSYAKMNAAYPHETTGDQFFSESQFESYRKLGFTLASRLGGTPAGVTFPTMESFFATLP